MEAMRGRAPGILVAVAHGVFSGSLNILLKFLISSLHFRFLTLLQLCTCAAAALGLEILRRLGRVDVPAFSLNLAKEFAPVCILSTLQSTLTLWSLRGLSLPMYVVFKRCLPFFTLTIGVCVLRNGVPSPGVLAAVAITTGGAALAGAGDLGGDPFGYVTGVLTVIVHASNLVLIQKTGADSEHGALTAQYAIAIMATPVLLVCAVISSDAVYMWSYPGWSDIRVASLFLCSVVLGCAMNFTTFHCTYLNSAVTTSFVGVVKSVVTITVGMLAFDDVAPTALFVGGVVVNTVGSVTYCVVKYFEIKKRSSYDRLEGGAKDAAPSGESRALDALTSGEPRPVDAPAENADDVGGTPAFTVTNENVAEKQKERPREDAAPLGRASGDFLGVWRSVRQLCSAKGDPLIHNMEQPSP
ncbi:solute carrier family 35 member D3 [Corythoichthys intestinalis]|uniref:solute carrier family 35 member D3 n=1 Tax=Corythoichthys intestinalis TaxID=161448 RepID=UPI0025A63C8F|nr:solute carrier family 35 member D3 [Corythoichthys intestinalis]XP_061806366.1 solute carrier family 35 member D3-like [Nerophis lumbriciformis]